MSESVAELEAEQRFGDRSGGEHDRLGRELVAADGDLALRRQGSGAAEDLDLVLVEQAGDAAGERLDHGVAVLGDRASDVAHIGAVRRRELPVGEDPRRHGPVGPVVADHELVGARADRERRHARVERVVVGVPAFQRIVRRVEEPLEAAVGLGDVAVEGRSGVVLGSSHI